MLFGNDFYTQDGEAMGYSAFGTVHKGRLKNGMEVAVQIVEVDRQDIWTVMPEVALLFCLEHENIVNCLSQRGSWVGTKFRSETFMELCTPLRDVWTKDNQSNDELVRDCTRQLVRGLQFLHDRKITHQNLKKDGVLINRDGIFKIGYFSPKATRTLTVNASGREQPIEGTPSHMAPEIIAQWMENKNPVYGTKADTWALGCLVLELYGKQPWSFDPDCAIHACAQLSRKFKETRGFPENAPTRDQCSPELWDFYTRVFERDPSKRATCGELLECDWLRGGVRPPNTQRLSLTIQGLTVAAVMVLMMIFYLGFGLATDDSNEHNATTPRDSPQLKTNHVGAAQQGFQPNSSVTPM